MIEGREVRAFGDGVVSPSYVEDVAAATVSLLREAAPHGLYPCVGAGHATRFEVATELANRLGVEPAIRGIAPDDPELPAPRPRFFALSMTRRTGCATDSYPPEEVAGMETVRLDAALPAVACFRRMLSGSRVVVGDPDARGPSRGVAAFGNRASGFHPRPARKALKAKLAPADSAW